MAETRRLVLVRHAQAGTGEPDRDRELTAGGRSDAVAVGRWLATAGLAPDLVICSTARRARQTWELAASSVDASLGGSPVRSDERLYDGGLDGLAGALAEVPDEVATVAAVGHNPTMQTFTVLMAGESVGDLLERARRHFPPACVAVLVFSGRWPDLVPEGSRLVELATPRGG